MSTIKTNNIQHVDATSANIALDSSGNATVNGTLTATSFSGDGSALTGLASDAISEGNTSAEVVDTGSDGHFKITTEGTERARIDSSGRLLVGTSTARSFAGHGGSKIQLEGTSYQTSTLSLINNQNAADGAYLLLGHSRGTSIGSATSVANGDFAGAIWFAGADGTNLVSAARIEAFIDGTPGTNDMPGRLVFSTTTDGTTAVTERMRINSKGQVIINNASGVTQGTGAGLFAKASTSSASDYTVHIINSATTQVVLGFRNDGLLRSEAIYAQTTSQAANIHVATDGFLYRSTSSARYKRDIVSAEYSLALIDQLRPVTYKSALKNADGQLSEEVFGGLIAEEVHAAGLTEFVEYDKSNKPDALRYTHMIAIAIKGLQEAHTRIQDLESEVAALKATINP